MTGNTELLFILFIVLLLFGGRKLPELARSMGEAAREFNKATQEPTRYVSESARKKDDEKNAIIVAAKKLGIEVEGRDISDIAEDIVKASSRQESS